jgi:hypothetical protein
VGEDKHNHIEKHEEAGSLVREQISALKEQASKYEAMA